MVSARTRAPRNACSAWTSSPARGPPVSEREGWARRRSSATGIPTKQDAEELEGVAEPPAELHVVEHERADERGGEEGEADDDEQVGAAAGEEKRVDRADAEEGVEEKAERQEGSASGLPASGTEGTRSGTSMPTRAEEHDGGRRMIWRTTSRRTLCGRFTDGNAASASIAAPTGSVAPPVKATRPFQPTIIPGVASPCSASSAAITEKAVPTRTVRGVAPARARDREAQRCGHRGDRREADTVEVDEIGRVDFVPADEDEGRGREGDAGRTDEQGRGGLCPKERSHLRLIGGEGRPGLRSIAFD